MHIAIVEDIPAEAAKLEKVLKSLSQKWCIAFEISFFSSGEQFIDNFEKINFNIIFMDIYLDNMTGVETAKKLRKIDSHCILIFLTSSIEYMSDAFTCHAFEYIQKPFDEKRIEQVMTDALNVLPKEMQYLKFTSSRQTVHMLYSDFLSAVTSDHYINILDINGNVYKSRQTFSEFMKPLKTDRRFLQINKGILVNMDYVISIEDNICTIKNGMTLPVKIRDSSKIKESWYKYGFEKIRTSQKRKER